jgi:hypothetical protein
MARARRVWLRLVTFFRSNRAEADMAREIEAHLRLLEDQFLAQGMSADSLMSFTLSRRTREIGIRVALGAAPRSIIRAIFSRAFGQIGLGILAGSDRRVHRRRDRARVPAAGAARAAHSTDRGAPGSLGLIPLSERALHRS